MKRATGSESTPTRRIWTTVSPPHVATSGRARPRSETKWPKRPTAVTAATVLRPIWRITAINYDATWYDAMLYGTNETADGTTAGHLLQRSVLKRSVDYAAKLARAFPTSPSRSRLSARSRSCRTRSRVTPSIPPISSSVCSRPRSEEHTSELQSHSDLVCRLLLEKKKTVKKV